MLTHKFGMMQDAPQEDALYETYEPERYGCISVADALIEPLLGAWSGAELFWHGLSRREKGLAYAGITLIPPEELGKLLATLPRVEAYAPLRALLQTAQERGKFVIHFGI